MGVQEIDIAGTMVGAGHKTFLIAEIAQAHEGSLGMAHAYIDAAAEAHVDAVKFQTHIAAAESTRDEQFRIAMSGQDQSRYEYWRRMEFTPEQWGALAAHAKDKGLIFLSSAFSLEAFELLEKLGMPAWKIGSGEFRSEDLLRAMIKTQKPILYSTGMSTYAEIDTVVSLLKKTEHPFALFQCTSQYPTPFENVGLNVIGEFQERYQCITGLSDHSGSPFPALAAMAQGADMIELHVTFDKRMYGPDSTASVTFQELEFLVRARDAFDIMQCSPVNKDDMAARMKDMRDLFTKSIGLREALPAGSVLAENMLVPKKPGTGIPFTERDKIIDRSLKHDTPADRLLRWEDFEDAS